MLNQGYGIMPNVVLFDKDISPAAKLIFVYISSLCAQEGYCWANNQHIALKFCISRSQVSRHIASLGKYIIIENPSNERRRIWLAENSKAGTQKAQTTLRKKRKHNNITNSTSIKGNLDRYKTPAQLGMPDLFNR